jgi:hypothetical protein
MQAKAPRHKLQSLIPLFSLPCRGKPDLLPPLAAGSHLSHARALPGPSYKKKNKKADLEWDGGQCRVTLVSQ